MLLCTKYFKMSTTSLVVRHVCDNTWPKFEPYWNFFNFFSPFNTKLPNLTEIFLIFSLLLTQNYAVLFLPALMLSSTLSLSPSSAAIMVCLLFFFLILFLPSQTTHPLLLPPIFFFFSCFCFSHPKHWNLTELNRNRMQSVNSAFFPYKSVLVFNILKPKFSIWCKNYLQYWST